jgi:hypothetical protein
VPTLGPPLTLVGPHPVHAVGHAGGRYTTIVWATDVQAYLGNDPLPDGFRVCAEHRENDTSADSDPILCMRRVPAGGWEHAVTTRGRTTWLRTGVLSDCAACHDTAPRGGVFGGT